MKSTFNSRRAAIKNSYVFRILGTVNSSLFLSAFRESSDDVALSVVSVDVFEDAQL